MVSSSLRMNVGPGGDRVNRPYDMSDSVLLMGAGLLHEVWPWGRGRGGAGGAPQQQQFDGEEERSEKARNAPE